MKTIIKYEELQRVITQNQAKKSYGNWVMNLSIYENQADACTIFGAFPTKRNAVDTATIVDLYPLDQSYKTNISLIFSVTDILECPIKILYII